MNTVTKLIKTRGHYMGRAQSWLAADKLIARNKSRAIVETGCWRGSDSDGCSTLILAELARRQGGHLDSYELEPKNIETARALVAEHGLSGFVTFHQGDSVLNLALRREPIDFAYLDSFDCGTGPDFSPCQEHQLAEVEAVLPLLNTKAAVMLDDHVPETGGKCRLSMKRLESRGFRALHTGYQVLYSTNDSAARPTRQFCVLTGHQPEYLPLALRTVYRNKAQYCLRHDYDLHITRGTLPGFYTPDTHGNGFTWSRLHIMWQLLCSDVYDWVWCVGADTLVTNFGRTLELIVERAGDAHLIIAGERVAPIQADSFLVRNSAPGREYLRTILAAHEQYRRDNWVENRAMIDLRERFDAMTYFAPQCELNSYDYREFYSVDPKYKDGTDCRGNRGQWKPGDFLVHWAGISMERRAQLLDIYEPLVTK